MFTASRRTENVQNAALSRASAWSRTAARVDFSGLAFIRGLAGAILHRVHNRRYIMDYIDIAGIWLVSKARKQQRDKGTYHAALNLRKQGVPLHIALGILAWER